jgi:hypothetical protein
MYLYPKSGDADFNMVWDFGGLFIDLTVQNGNPHLQINAYCGTVDIYSTDDLPIDDGWHKLTVRSTDGSDLEILVDDISISSDSGVLGTILSGTVQELTTAGDIGGESIGIDKMSIYNSVTTPGVTAPTELILWQPMAQKLPISMLKWSPAGMGFGIDGYKFIWKILVSYKSTAAITLTITTYDGYNPTAITLPSTSGAHQKKLFTLTPNKGLLFFFSAVSTAEWTPYFDEWEIHVGKWGRNEPCAIFRNLTELMGEGDA